MTAANTVRLVFCVLPAALLASHALAVCAEPQKAHLQIVSLSQAKTPHIADQRAVNIFASVGADGIVSAARAVGGDRRTRQSALDAVRRWKFEPSSRPSRIKINIECNLGR
jgi:hypothetical protein